MIEGQERYLDAVEETYEVSKWNLDLEKAINETSSVGAKNRLKALKDEMEVRRKNGKLS
jgi:hypothetical protein